MRRLWARSLWHHHPGVRTGSELSFGERAADMMRLAMGSWAFVGSFLAFMAIWAATKGFGVDVFPYILLNLFLSMLAGLQGAILLIAAKRADQVASEVAKHTLDNTDAQAEVLRQHAELLAQNTALTEQVAKLTTEIHERLPVA